MSAMSIRNRILMLAACLLAPLSFAATAPAPLADSDFRTLTPPQPTSNPAKIEVTEFFSFACPHCNAFYPLLTTWAATQPKDVVVVHVPVGFNRPAWINLQRAYYALQSSGDIERLEGALFHAIHDEGRQLFDEPSLAEWVGANGGNAEKFAAAYTSFAVNDQTVQADREAESYGVEGVPTMAVNGEYVSQGKTFAEILDNTSKLIAKVRAERSGAAPAAKHK
jgi:protein dithiol oxidoreductase (disulfide-forming)